MTDQNEAPKYAIYIEFTEYGSVMFNINMTGGILPLQLMALGDYLTTVGRATFLEQREMSRVQVPRTPEPKIILPS